MSSITSVKELSKYTPAYEPVSLREPTLGERKVDEALKAYMDVEMKLESDEEMLKRDTVLSEVRGIFLKWVQFIATQVLHMPEEEAEEAGGELFISGSHRLGVRDIGADIDTVCVAPNFCTREHFFTHLKESFQNHPDVTELNAVEGALVPIISFDFRGVSIDLLFARLSENVVPKDVDILDDNILKGLDDATEKSLNGPRVTNMIFKLVGEKTFPNFLIVLRCIRRWAKKRGLYGNKLGYLGGINCNILVAFICQLYPNAGPSSLLIRFFKQYKDWEWPNPIMLNNIQQNPPDASISEQREIWSPQNNPAQHLMPIITPAYPAMNSSYSVNKHTFQVMCEEFTRGFKTMEIIAKQKGLNNCWDALFEPSDFFIKYSHYLACHVIGTTKDSPQSRSWIGFVESRIRNIVNFRYLETLPLKHPIQLHPVMSKTQKSEDSLCYFVGFNLDLEQIAQLRDKNIHIDEVAARFSENLLDPERGYKGERVEGLDFYVEHISWKKLPVELYESQFGSKEIAKQKRIELGYAVDHSTTRKRSLSELSATAATVAGGAVGGENEAKEVSTKEESTTGVQNELMLKFDSVAGAMTGVTSGAVGAAGAAATAVVVKKGVQFDLSGNADRYTHQAASVKTEGGTTAATAAAAVKPTRKRVLAYHHLIKSEPIYYNTSNSSTSINDNAAANKKNKVSDGTTKITTTTGGSASDSAMRAIPRLLPSDCVNQEMLKRMAEQYVPTATWTLIEK